MRSLRSILLFVGLVTLAAACHKKNESTTPTGENKSEVTGTGGETYGTGEGIGDENPCGAPDEGMDPCGGGE